MFILFILSLILMVLAFWGIEKKFNFFYETKSWFDNISNRLQQQTKLKIDIFKIIIVIITGGIIAYLCFFLVKKLYLPYFEQILDVSKGGSFVLKSLDEDSPDLISNWFVFSSLINDSLNFTENDNSSRISDWGTFGDFIGGTLNPILTFLSICLILYTVYQNKKSLDFNSEELALSRKAQQDSANSQRLIQKTQNLQQFDSLFFSLLNQFKYQQDQLCSLDENGKSKVDKIYRSIFVDDYELDLDCKRHKILQNQELSQYYICLYQLFKLINSKIDRSPNEVDKIEEWGDYALEKQYTNILRALIPPKLQQLLFLNAYTSFDEYRWYLSYYSFLEHMPFKNLERGDELNVDLLVIAKFYKLDSQLLKGDFQVFGESIYFYTILNKSCYSEFIESDECFFSGWELVKEKFLNFNEIICLFNPVDVSNYATTICYEYIIIRRNIDGFIVNVKCVYRNDLKVNENVKTEKRCKINSMRFQNYGFSLYVDSNLSLHFYGVEDFFIKREQNDRYDESDFVEIKKENPL